MSGNNYCGLTIKWNYDEGHVDISMPGYIDNLLRKFPLPSLKQPQYAPYKWTTPKFGMKRQYAKEIKNSPLLSASDKRTVQQIVGSLLYYSRAVDPTMLVALNDIASQQATPTNDTLQQCSMLLDYARTYKNATLRFRRSDMILHVDSDAAYLVQPNARSRIAGYYHLSSIPPLPPITPKPSLNGPILVECKTIRHVVASSAEAETGGLFLNAQNIIPLRWTLEQLGHKQPPTPLKTDNNTAYNFVSKNMKQRKSKSWDMRYNWLRDKELQRLLRIFWERGSLNNADYFTKHHPPSYHKQIRSRYILTANHNMILKNDTRRRGCVKDWKSQSRKSARIARSNVQTLNEDVIQNDRTDRQRMTSPKQVKAVQWKNPISVTIN